MADLDPSKIILGQGEENVRLAYSPWMLNKLRRMNALGVYSIPFNEIATGRTAAGLAYVAPLHPGPLPENAGNNAEYQAALKAWELDFKVYALFGKNMTLAKEMFFECSSDLSAQLTTHLGGDMATLDATAPNTYTAVLALWSHPTATDLEGLRNTLNDIFIYENSKSLQKYLSMHRHAHQILAANHAVISEEDKINMLKTCLKGSSVASHFSFGIATFDMSNNTPGAPNRTFAALAAIMEIANDQIQFSMKAAYSVAPTSAAAMLPPLPKKSKQPTKWCWTHGEGKHNSNQCERQAEGHMATATKANQMGSKTPFARKVSTS